MKAVFIEKQGGVEVLQYGERPEPVPGPGEVKVRVRACALNRLDLYARMGIRGVRINLDKDGSRILGNDCAGDVAELGPGVDSLSLGQRVAVQPHVTCGQCSPCLSGHTQSCIRKNMLGIRLDGGYAEYVVVPAVNLHPVPDHLSYEETAAMTAVFLVTWNALLRRGKLQPWETCLVLSGSGGVGSAAVQVVKKVIGARCIATTSTQEKAELIKELGADEVINYQKENLVDRVRELTDGGGVNMVVDHTGTSTFEQCFDLLSEGGRYAICGVTTGHRAQIFLGKLFTRELTVFGVDNGTKEDMRQIVHMASRGVIRGIVGRTFPLEQAAEAHRAMEETDFFGKLVLQVP